MTRELYDELASSIGLENNYKATIVSATPSPPPLNREVDKNLGQFTAVMECSLGGKCVKIENVPNNAKKTPATVEEKPSTASAIESKPQTVQNLNAILNNVLSPQPTEEKLEIKVREQPQAKEPVKMPYLFYLSLF